MEPPPARSTRARTQPGPRTRTRRPGGLSRRSTAGHRQFGQPARLFRLESPLQTARSDGQHKGRVQHGYRYAGLDLNGRRHAEAGCTGSGGDERAARRHGRDDAGRIHRDDMRRAALPDHRGVRHRVAVRVRRGHHRHSRVAKARECDRGRLYRELGRLLAHRHPGRAAHLPDRGADRPGTVPRRRRHASRIDGDHGGGLALPRDRSIEALPVLVRHAGRQVDRVSERGEGNAGRRNRDRGRHWRRRRRRRRRWRRDRNGSGSAIPSTGGRQGEERGKDDASGERPTGLVRVLRRHDPPPGGLAPIRRDRSVTRGEIAGSESRRMTPRGPASGPSHSAYRDAGAIITDRTASGAACSGGGPDAPWLSSRMAPGNSGMSPTEAGV